MGKQKRQNLLQNNKAVDGNHYDSLLMFGAPCSPKTPEKCDHGASAPAFHGGDLSPCCLETQVTLPKPVELSLFLWRMPSSRLGSTLCAEESVFLQPALLLSAEAAYSLKVVDSELVVLSQCVDLVAITTSQSEAVSANVKSNVQLCSHFKHVLRASVSTDKKFLKQQKIVEARSVCAYAAGLHGISEFHWLRRISRVQIQALRHLHCAEVNDLNLRIMSVCEAVPCTNGATAVNSSTNNSFGCDDDRRFARLLKAYEECHTRVASDMILKSIQGSWIMIGSHVIFQLGSNNFTFIVEETQPANGHRMPGSDCRHLAFFVTRDCSVVVLPPIAITNHTLAGHTSQPRNVNTAISGDRSDADHSSPESLKGFARVGGLDHVISALQRNIIAPLICPSLHESYGVRPPKGVLLHGVPGCGKSLLASALHEELGIVASINNIRCPAVDIVDISTLSCDSGSSTGETNNETPSIEKNISMLFKRARGRLQLKPPQSTLLFVDEIDVICPKREESTEMERRMVSTFLTELDSARAERGIALLAATNRPHALDPAIRRAGRIDCEIEIGVPNALDRTKILQRLLMSMPHSLTNMDIQTLAADCHAFVGADLRSICTTAAMQAFEELNSYNFLTMRPKLRNDREKIQINMKHFVAARAVIRPSGMKELAIDVPKVNWSDIGGYEAEKQKLQECVEWPIKYDKIFRELRLSAPRGVLLFGPPGCSKTLMAKAVATESKMNFTSVKGPELFSKWVGESERAVRDLFRRARQNAPCVIFFDEIDALGSDRSLGGSSSGVESRVLSQLLNELDGVASVKQLVVIGATNRPDLMDDALLRPGRFDRLVYIPLPDSAARHSIFDVHLKDLRIDQTAISVRSLVHQTEGYTGAEIAMVCREASMHCLRRNIRIAEEYCSGSAEGEERVVLENMDFEEAIKVVRPRIPKTLISFYEHYVART
eukprot:Lankesteria_metandrocarpae@DN1252_c0_g1_i1.p1